MKRGYIDESPARFIANPRPVRPLGQGKAATDEEVKLMLQAAQFNPRDRAVLLLLVQSGCRCGEAAKLRLQDLVLADRTALVDGKGDVRRRIYFGKDAADALHKWLEERPDADHDHVFTFTRDHGPLTSDGISRIIRRLSKKVGLKRTLGTHSLRHRVGLKFGREHVPVRIAQAFLGHARPEITFGYYQDVDDDDLRQAGKLLGFDL